MTDFWRTWLTLWCWVVGAFGALLALGGIPATSGPSAYLLTLMGGTPVTFNAPLHFAVALMGVVTAGWAATMYFAIRAADRLGARGADIWRGLLLSILGWYIIDSGLSIATGFALNAVSNTLLLIGFLVPLFRSGVLRPATS
jgi:hypothetical protein